MTENITEVVAPTTVPEAPQLFLAPRFPRVNLLPPQVLARRRLHRTQQLLAGGLACVLAAVGGAWYVEHTHVASAQRQVDAQQARSALLTRQVAHYAEVPVVLAQVDRVKLAQAQSMVSDVLWYQIIDAISRQAPPGVWIKDLTISVNQDATAGATSTALPAGDPLAKPAIATISMSGYGVQPDDVANWLDALTHIPGFSDARYSQSNLTPIGTTPVTQFSSTVGVTSVVLSHRFDQKGS